MSELAAEISKLKNESSRIESTSVEEALKAPLADVLDKLPFSPNPIVQKVLEHMREHNKQRSLELTELVESTQVLVKALDHNPKHVYKLVSLKLKQDLDTMQMLDKALKAYSPSALLPIMQTTYHLKNNKMTLVIAGARELLSKEKNFFDLFYEYRIPEGFSFEYHPRNISVSGWNPTSIWGNPRGSYLTAATITMNLVCSGSTHLEETYLFGSRKLSVRHSALVMGTPMPTKLVSELEAHSNFLEFSFANTHDHRSTFFNVHGGYIYGGARHTHAVCSFEDCTSYTAKVTGCTALPPTSALAEFYQGSQKPGIASLASVYKPKRIKNYQTDIRAGDLYCHVGEKGGHSAIIVQDGVITESGKNPKIVTITFGRNIPEGDDGFKVELRSPESTKDRKVMIFSVAGNEVSRAASPHTLASPSQRDRSESAPIKIAFQ